jgi:hypothetical protein
VRFNVVVERTGHVWGERYWSEILAGEVDWVMVEVKAKTEIPKGMTYELSWNSPRLAGMTEKLRFSFKTVPVPASPSG